MDSVIYARGMFLMRDTTRLTAIPVVQRLDPCNHDLSTRELVITRIQPLYHACSKHGYRAVHLDECVGIGSASVRRSHAKSVNLGKKKHKEGFSTPQFVQRCTYKADISS